MQNPKIHSTTQSFIEIEDIVNDVVYQKGGNACIILEVSSVNFYLLSKEEQEARIFGFMSFLNSLNFAVQILIITKNVDVGAYLNSIDQKIVTESHPKIAEHLKKYKDFVQSLVKTKNLLDKKFYVIVPFSTLELGPIPKGVPKSSKDENFKKIETAIQNKKASVLTQLQRMGLSAKHLTTNEIIKLFYEAYNDETMHFEYDAQDPKNIILQS